MPLIEDQFEDTLLLIRDGPRAVLAVPDGNRWVLPVVRTHGHHPADVRSTLRAIQEQLGRDAVVLASHHREVVGGVAHRLLEIELVPTPLDSRRGSDQRWITVDEVPQLLGRTIAHHIRTLLIRRLDSRAQQPPIVDGRAWTRPGWWASATAWLQCQVEARGGRILRVEQIRSWEFSCVLRVYTDQGELYLKALPRAYAGEPALTLQLASWYPRYLPEVVATDLRQRWLLVRACPGNCLEEGAPLATWQQVARAYARMQVASIDRLERLRALGCRNRPVADLRSQLRLLAADEAALLMCDQEGLTPSELDRLRMHLPLFEAACDTLTSASIPPALEHGDLWWSNVFVAPRQAAFIDWTDACISHPFLSLAPFLRSASWDDRLAGVSDARRQIADAYLRPWSSYSGRTHLRQLLALAEPLAALHIAVAYWRLTPSKHSQWWMPRAVPFFVRMALESLPPDQASITC